MDSVDAGTHQLGMVIHFPALRAVTGGVSKMNANVIVRWVQEGAAESCASGDYNYDDAILGQSLTLSTSGTLELFYNGDYPDRRIPGQPKGEGLHMS